MFERYQEWKKQRRVMREARMLAREARRALRKWAHRITERGGREVKEQLATLESAADEKRWDDLPGALNDLDRSLDEHLPFARKSTLREYTESIAVAVLIALFLRAFVVEAFKIPSGSMIPTLQVGDHIFVNKFIYGIRVPWTEIKFGTEYRKPRRGEVIVFIYPVEKDKDFIKRIVAVEGDTVEIRDNVLYVNGQPVPRTHVDEDCHYIDFDEQSARWEPHRCEKWKETLDGNTFTTVYERNGPVRSWAPRVVPPRSVFVMGDNRDNSHDSRFWGFVPYNLIKGKAMVIWFSSGEPEGWIRLARLFHLVQ